MLTLSPSISTLFVVLICFKGTLAEFSPDPFGFCEGCLDIPWLFWTLTIALGAVNGLLFLVAFVAAIVVRARDGLQISVIASVMLSSLAMAVYLLLDPMGVRAILPYWTEGALIALGDLGALCAAIGTWFLWPDGRLLLHHRTMQVVAFVLMTLVLIGSFVGAYVEGDWWIYYGPVFISYFIVGITQIVVIVVTKPFSGLLVALGAIASLLAVLLGPLGAFLMWASRTQLYPSADLVANVVFAALRWALIFQLTLLVALFALYVLRSKQKY